MALRTGKIIRILLLLLILAGTLPFFFPPGRPLLSWKSIETPKLPDIDVSMPSFDSKEEATTRPVTVYRWKDSQGGWHYSNQAPEGDVAYERMSVNPDTNMVPAEPVAQAEAPAPEGQEIQSANEEFDYSPEEVLRLKEKAREARDKMERRYKEQEELLRQ